MIKREEFLKDRRGGVEGRMSTQENVKDSQHHQGGLQNGIVDHHQQNGVSTGDKEITKKPKRRSHKHKKRAIPDYDALAECRKMFRQEMLLLGKELVQFRNMCNLEISKYKHHLQYHKDKLTEEENKKQNENNKSETGETAVEMYWQTKLDTLQSDMTYLEKKQSQLDREQQLLDKEDELFERQQEIEKYEKEIDEIESVLDRRQAHCAKRETDLLSLEEELQKYKQDLDESKTNLEKRDEESVTERAKKNWEVLRKSLQDKETVLESTVKKYRAELASSTSYLTAKNIMIDKLDEQVKRLQAEVEDRDRKIKQLESRLILSIQTFNRHNGDDLKSEKSNLSNQSSIDSVFESSPTRQPKRKPLGSSLKLGGKYDSMAHPENNNELNNSDNKLTPEYENGGRKQTSPAKVIRHPFRQSIDMGNEARFQGLKSPLHQEDEKSSSCAVM